MRMPPRAKATAAPRAAIYARFSSENQRDASIEDQVRVCRGLAAREGWEVAETFTDYAVSGASTLRPGYQALLGAMRAGSIQVVISESLDRLSRDQEHVAGLFKQASFAGVRIVTQSEGEVSELHIGLKGTMGALYLKDLADKTRRGLEGRVRQGRSGGGVSYGYRIVRGPIDRNGDFERGLREIDPIKAQVVRRIFRDYAAGLSAIRIAHQLNKEGIASPRGEAWAPSAIVGNRHKGTGILNNRLYIGELVWNQRRWIKDPATGRRVARDNDAGAVVTQEVPELRIVPQEDWDRVRARQAQMDKPQAPGVPGVTNPFWAKQRPRFLFSGLMRCGECGGGYSKSSATHFSCSVARNKGETGCTNRLTIRQDKVEGTVIGALRERLMDPDVFAVFVEAFTEEWNRLQGERSASLAQQQGELTRVERQLEKLVDALADGAPVSTVKDRMVALEARREELRATLSESKAPAPRLHPNLAQMYRRKVAELADALAREDGAEVRKQLRGLVEEVKLIPDEGTLRVEVRGALAAVLALGNEPQNAKSPSLWAGALVSQIKVDAGTGFEPVTFRL